MKMTTEQKALLTSWGQTFLAAALAAYFAIGTAPWEIDQAGWKAVVGAGVFATLKVVYNYVSPKDNRFGIGSGTDPLQKIANSDPNDVE